MVKRTEEDQRAIDNLTKEELEGASSVYYVGHKAGRHSVYKEQEPTVLKSFMQFIGMVIAVIVCCGVVYWTTDIAYKRGETDAYLDICKQVEASYDVPPEDSPCKLEPNLKLTIKLE